jgi:hypothetical protein
LGEKDWFTEWIKVSASAGLLDLTPIADDHPIVIMPGRTPGGIWDFPRHMSSNEITFWLRRALMQNGFDPREVDNLSSHSCKTTILSWAAKKGLDKSVRKILGYNVQLDDVSPLTYGRDNLSAPLYQAIAMMKEIAIARQGSRNELKFHMEQPLVVQVRHQLKL